LPMHFPDQQMRAVLAIVAACMVGRAFAVAGCCSPDATISFFGLQKTKTSVPMSVVMTVAMEPSTGRAATLTETNSGDTNSTSRQVMLSATQHYAIQESSNFCCRVAPGTPGPAPGLCTGDSCAAHPEAICFTDYIATSELYGRAVELWAGSLFNGALDELVILGAEDCLPTSISVFGNDSDATTFSLWNGPVVGPVDPAFFAIPSYCSNANPC